jgi:cytochrome c553
VGAQAFVVNLEISRGPEPSSHLNPNWISLHNQSINQTCSNCHTTENPGGTSNTSFCSNSACHGNVYTYVGFDAPALREILKLQLPTPEPIPSPAPITGSSTFEANFSPLFAAKCTMCHGTNATAGLSFLT